MKEINRREFLKASTAAGVVLMAGSVVPGGDPWRTGPSRSRKWIN